jgi:glycine betaine/proline transport system substrate-binding protein
VAALDLPFEVIHAGTDAALFAELESAIQRQAPVILWVYAPHWAPAKYAGDWVQFPAYTPECYADPAWGSNPAATHDCGKPTGPIWKVASSVLGEKWPGAKAAVEKFSITNDEMGAMITAADLDGKPVSEVVAGWMAANEARWSTWIAK